MRDFVHEGAQYGAAEVLLFDPVPAHRGTTRSTLGMLGFKQVVATSDVNEVAQNLAQKPFDVLIADLTAESERICKLVRDIRQGVVGGNPFLTVLLTTWGVREDALNAVMNSGADDVLIRPYSVAFLAERVRTLVDARKAFVVTADYIGPDRRKNPDRASDKRLLEVPNTLRSKARPGASGASETDVMSAVREVRVKVEELRLVGTAFQVRLLSHFALKAGNDGTPLEKYVAPLSAFSRLLHDKFHKASDSALASAVVSLLEAVGFVVQGEDVIRSLETSSGCAKTIYECLCTGRDAAELEEEFANAIERLTQREARTLSQRRAAG